MPYTSQTDIENAAGGNARLVQLADWEGQGAVDAAVIAAVQAAADGWIDGFLNKLYATPIPNPTSTLVQLAAEECVYQLRLRRGQVSEEDQQRRDKRQELLLLMNKGVVRPSNPAPAKSDAVRSEAVVNNRDASRENLKGFV